MKLGNDAMTCNTGFGEFVFFQEIHNGQKIYPLKKKMERGKKARMVKANIFLLKVLF